MSYMAAQMDMKIEAGIMQNAQLCLENEKLKVLVYWAYTKLRDQPCSNIEDALKLGEMKLLIDECRLTPK